MSIANIKLANFNYKKVNNDLSKRTVVVVEETPDRILALEVIGGDLTPAQPYLAYMAEMEELKEHLRAKHGIDSNKIPFKSFLLSGITGRQDIDLTINL